MGNVLLVLASRNFRDEEYLETKRELEAAGHTTTTASSSTGPVRGALGTWVKPDKLLAQCRARDYDAIAFIGGYGALEYVGNRTAARLVREALDHGKLIGAICVGPAILTWTGVLRGRRATSHPSVWDALEAGGVNLARDEQLVLDPPFVTANGPKAAAQFGRALASLLAVSAGK